MCPEYDLLALHLCLMSVITFAVVSTYQNFANRTATDYDLRNMSWRHKVSPKKWQEAAQRLSMTPTMVDGPSLDDWLGRKSPTKPRKATVNSEGRPFAVFLRGRTGVVGLRPTNASSSRFTAQGDVGDDPQFSHQHIDQDEAVIFNIEEQSWHQCQCNQQWHAWNTQVLPSLIEPYMELLCVTNNFHDHPIP